MMSDVMAADLLGGTDILRQLPEGNLGTHDMLLQGLPAGALQFLVEHLQVLTTNESLQKAVGISLRTFQRQKDTPDRPLSIEQSGRTWKFAELLALASKVFGNQRAAEEWMERPAIGLAQRRPIDLLSTSAGVEMVERYLNQIHHGVYV